MSVTSEKSWEERIADYIWKEFWVSAVVMIFVAGLLWFLDVAMWPSLGYAFAGIVLSIIMNFKRDFPKRNGL